MTAQGLDQFSSSEKPGNRCDPTCREQLRVWCHQWFNALRAREALPPVRRMPSTQMESCADRRAEYDSQLQRDGMPDVNVTEDCKGLSPMACLFGVIHTNTDGWHASWPFKISSLNCEGVPESMDDWWFSTQVSTYRGQSKSGRQSLEFVGED